MIKSTKPILRQNRIKRGVEDISKKRNTYKNISRIKAEINKPTPINVEKNLEKYYKRKGFRDANIAGNINNLLNKRHKIFIHNSIELKKEGYSKNSIKNIGKIHRNASLALNYIMDKYHNSWRYVNPQFKFATDVNWGAAAYHTKTNTIYSTLTYQNKSLPFIKVKEDIKNIGHELGHALDAKKRGRLITDLERNIEDIFYSYKNYNKRPSEKRAILWENMARKDFQEDLKRIRKIPRSKRDYLNKYYIRRGFNSEPIINWKNPKKIGWLGADPKYRNKQLAIIGATVAGVGGITYLAQKRRKNVK
ncbi:MAG: hypothetical protein AABY07_10775 [Nanoarchaeota archaeon]